MASAPAFALLGIDREDIEMTGNDLKRVAMVIEQNGFATIE
ncbi:hypothetical protein [uncultured Bradyrhizobium sp.]|nr:hypothetical protein [uncultured Bradyrhizobium sp.]